MVNYFPIILGLLAGLSLFLYGVTRLSLSLRKIAGDKMKRILERFTSNIFLAVFAGILVTIVLDSSSITIIMIIALVNAKLIPFDRSIGVIMGANIGTAVSSQIIAFQITEYSAVLLLGGFVLYFFSKKKKMLKYVGLTLFGFGLIFFGLGMMGQATEPLRDSRDFINWIKTLEHPWKGVLIGAGLTAIIQSSSATMGIVITLASQKMISLAVGVTVMLGAEIGTCADTLFASIGRSKEALKAGIFHLVFNILTVVIGVVFYKSIAEISSTITVHNVARQIANAHMIFNIGGVVIFVWFTPQIANILNWAIPEDGNKRHLKTPSLQ